MNGQINKCFAFNGTHLGDNNVIIANNHYPANNSTNENQFCIPFSKVVSNKENLSSPILQISNIAYYEVKIHPPPPYELFQNRTYEMVWTHNPNSGQYSARNENSGESSCIAIGLACAKFPLQNRMPGW